RAGEEASTRPRSRACSACQDCEWRRHGQHSLEPAGSSWAERHRRRLSPPWLQERSRDYRRRVARLRCPLRLLPGNDPPRQARRPIPLKYSGIEIRNRSRRSSMAPVFLQTTVAWISLVSWQSTLTADKPTLELVQTILKGPAGRLDHLTNK